MEHISAARGGKLVIGAYRTLNLALLFSLQCQNNTVETGYKVTICLRRKKNFTCSFT